MNSDQIEMFEQVRSMQIELTKAYKEYWGLHSGFDAWQFWFNVAILVIVAL